MAEHDSNDHLADESSLHTIIAKALDAIRRGEEGEALDHLMPLVDPGDEPGDDLAAAVWELASVNADMLRDPDGLAGDEVPVAVRLRGPDGEDVGIDDVEPALRAAARILLAFVNEHEEDARLQLEIVAATESPDDMLLVFLHTAGWTLALFDAGEDTGVRLPGWLRRVARQF
jgi:hypothetical protein